MKININISIIKHSKTLFILSIPVLTVWIALSASSPATASETHFNNGLSLQGYTGLLNTPNAHVTDEGWLNAIYTNQEESKWRQKTPFQDNYLFSLGLFNFVELGGRFLESPGTNTRDLSANLKITSAPLTRESPYLPVVAAGVADPSGGAVLLKTSYLVISEDIWRLRMSAGYGRGPDRLKGAFAGAEFKAHDWVYLLGEYDTAETNMGVRVVLPQYWKVPVNVTATAKTSLDYKPGNFELAFGANIPLDFRMKRTERPPFPVNEPTGNQEIKSSEQKLFRYQKSKIDNSPSAISSKIISKGFLNVRVGTYDRILVVEYENTIFNHNELDALGLIAGLASESAPEHIDTLRIITKKRNIRLMAVTMPLSDLRTFLEKPEGVQKLRDALIIDFEARETDSVIFAGGDNNSALFNTSLTLIPGLTTFIGTEVGAFDYLLSLKPELTTLLWKGAAATARWDIPLSWSDNLRDGMLYRSNRQPAQLERLMLFQAVKPYSSVMLNLGAGMVVHDRNGILNEAVWNPGDGQHRFKITQGWNEHISTHKQLSQLLGAYRYYYSPFDLSIESIAGRFWAEDLGYSLEVKRFWEDTAVSLFYKDSEGIDQKKWKSVGIQFTFPLTPRRDMKPVAKMQLQGSNEWAYAQETTLKNNNYNNPRGELNYLPPYPLALNPQTSLALNRSFYNRDRLSTAYIKQHLVRLRESWLKYRDCNN